LPVAVSTPPAVVDRALADRHSAVFVRLSKLPPFRPAALKLLNISVESDSAMEDFEEAFKSDPALTADLLLVANSAEFGLPCRIETIKRAISHLGLERVRELGCTIAFSFFVRNLPRTEYGRAVWAHSIATAVIAEAAEPPNRPRVLYTAGLMHDLGRLALSLSVGARYAEDLSQEFPGLAEANAFEKAQYGFTHLEAGSMVAQKWGFPASLLVGMANHHEPLEGRPDDPLNQIRMACRVADWLGFPEVVRREPEAAEALTLPAEPDELRQRITQRVAAFG
jgi:HD-like signal output (HDOD) protein